MIRAQIDFANRAELAFSLARKVSHVLSKSISKTGSAVLAVSGGATPALFFHELSKTSITWEKVAITLVDERQVPIDSPRSNARLVQQTLLCNHAAAAKFVPLFRNPVASRIADFSAVVLGMGTDGHTASFFPGGDTLSEALNPSSLQSLIEISSPGSCEPRLTFTLQKLLAANLIVLHIEGRQKLTVLAKAVAGHDAMKMPVRAVLQAEKPVDIYWCP